MYLFQFHSLSTIIYAYMYMYCGILSSQRIISFRYMYMYAGPGYE